MVLEKNPNIAELYKELMMLLHEHFQELEEKEERTAAKVGSSQSVQLFRDGERGTILN